MTRILGIETSCDETSAAIVSDTAGSTAAGEVLSNVVLSQIEDHAAFGGVVPEIAARSHLTHLDAIISRALEDAGTTLTELDAIAVTAGPGLAGGLIVGTMMARAIAVARDLPLFHINHLEGHALTPRLTDNVAFPYLLLLVSGGHTQILVVRGVGNYERWATTIDDALGEAFDKTAKLLGLPYPGGPAVERSARSGNPKAHAFPRPLAGRPELDMSFSGLKTAVRLAGQKAARLDEKTVADICASFQQAVSDVLSNRLERAMNRFQLEESQMPTVVVAGGVAANQQLRTALQAAVHQAAGTWVAPPLELCTDNAAMIAWAGLERYRLGLGGATSEVRTRWPLDTRNLANFGSGKRGAKA